MIQEPQKKRQLPTQDTIQPYTIPTHKSMTTTPHANTILNNNQNQNQKNNTISNKNRTTVVQIPKQNSKPRIFLLTRPSQTPLIRSANQSVQHHHQKDLNTLVYHHPQSRDLEAISPPTKRKIIRIPFLPGLPAQGIEVKKNNIQEIQQIKKNLQITKEEDNRQYLQKHSVVLQQQQPQSKSHIERQSVNQKKSTQHKIINLNCSEQNLNRIEKKSQIPLTLATMAGIELTGADISLSAADMSGAMPPTATVEEINVPVFIDEYLQQATESSTTEAATVAAESNTTAVTTTNNTHFINSNFIIVNNNQQQQQQHKGQQQSNVKGNPEALDEHFEFDINLLTAEHSRVEGKQQQQQASDDQKQFSSSSSSSLSSIDFDTESSDKLIEEILFSINSNNNKNNNINNNNNNNISGTSISCNMLSSTTNNNNNMVDSPDLEESIKQEEQNIFGIAPNSQLLDMELFNCEEISMVYNDEFFKSFDSNGLPLDMMEDAIDIAQMGNENLSLNDCFINTQPNDIMFSGGSNSALTSSQSLSQQYPKVAELSQEILQAEPFLPLEDEPLHYPNLLYSAGVTASNCQHATALLTSCGTIDEHAAACEMDRMEYSPASPSFATTLNPLKRVNSSQTNKHMAEKRSKLRLDIKRSEVITTSASTPADALNTPGVIQLIMDNDQQSSQVMSPAENSFDIFNRLIGASTEANYTTDGIKCKIEVHCEDTTNTYDDTISPPYTPFSYDASASNQTNFTGCLNTAPSSPASSINTSFNTSSNTSASTSKRGRGRPAKLHSDVPDLSALDHLNEDEKKKLLERAKNNEASRKSRLKNKERDQAMEKEEEILKAKSKKLKAELKKWQQMEDVFTDALKKEYLSKDRRK